MSESFAKPPLGAEPVWLAHINRMQDLSNAILRNITDKNYSPNYVAISAWAEEISALCKMIHHIGEGGSTR